MTLYIVNKEKAVLISKVKLGIDTERDLVLPLNKTSVAGYVALSGEMVRIKNVYDAKELDRIDSRIALLRQG